MRKKLGIIGSIVVLLALLFFVVALSWPAPTIDAEFSVDYDPTEWPAVEPDAEYVARDGQPLPLRVYGEKDRDTALILLHGISIYGYYFDEMATYLADRSVATVFVPDLRGHGYAPAPRGDLDYEEQLVDDVADLVAHVRAEMPKARIVLGGHSGGGGLAVRFAGSEQADDVDGYLLMAPALGLEAPSTREDFGGLIELRLPTVIALSLLNGMRITGFDGQDVLYLAYPDDLQRERMVLTYTWRYAKGFSPPDYAGSLNAIDVPLLLVAGDDDEIFAAEHYPSILEDHAPHGEIVIKPGYKHFEDLLNEPQTLAVYASWLKELE